MRGWRRLRTVFEAPFLRFVKLFKNYFSIFIPHERHANVTLWGWKRRNVESQTYLFTSHHQQSAAGWTRNWQQRRRRWWWWEEKGVRLWKFSGFLTVLNGKVDWIKINAWVPAPSCSPSLSLLDIFLRSHSRFLNGKTRMSFDSIEFLCQKSFTQIKHFLARMDLVRDISIRTMYMCVIAKQHKLFSHFAFLWRYIYTQHFFEDDLWASSFQVVIKS